MATDLVSILRAGIDHMTQRGYADSLDPNRPRDLLWSLDRGNTKDVLYDVQEFLINQFPDDLDWYDVREEAGVPQMTAWQVAWRLAELGHDDALKEAIHELSRRRLFVREFDAIGTIWEEHGNRGGSAYLTVRANSVDEVEGVVRSYMSENFVWIASQLGLNSPIDTDFLSVEGERWCFKPWHERVHFVRATH